MVYIIILFKGIKPNMNISYALCTRIIYFNEIPYLIENNRLYLKRDGSILYCTVNDRNYSSTGNKMFSVILNVMTV